MEDQKAIEESQAAKNEFVAIFNSVIKRDGADKLLAYMQKSDFFVAPASTKFHNACYGGLCAHSLNVYRRLKAMVEAEKAATPYFATVSAESIAICGLLHDLCKMDFYKSDFRNVKVNGVWEQVPYYSVDDALPYGHGEKSVYVISGFMRLTREEAMAINWHMGGFDMRVKGGDYSISGAFEKFPLAVMVSAADMTATYFDERRG